MTRPGHPHPAAEATDASAADAAAGEPGVAGAVIGLVDGRAVSRAVLDGRVRELREGPLRATLPAPGTSEDRQLARWLTQIILTEVLCEREAAARGLAPVEGGPLDRVAAVELGSINAAAYNNSPWVRAVFADVTASAEVPVAWRSPATERDEPRHLVWHRLFDDPAGAGAATADDLEPLGAVTLGSLPAAVAGALRRAPYGMVVQVEDALGRHVALAHPAPDTPAQDHPASGKNESAPGRDNPAPATDHPVPVIDDPGRVVQAARRRVFSRWVDEMRAGRVELVFGLEHPGDPRQPDNHHKH